VKETVAKTQICLNCLNFGKGGICGKLNKVVMWCDKACPAYGTAQERVGGK
jgi:hypothetical protein